MKVTEFIRVVEFMSVMEFIKIMKIVEFRPAHQAPCRVAPRLISSSPSGPINAARFVNPLACINRGPIEWKRPAEPSTTRVIGMGIGKRDPSMHLAVMPPPTVARQ